MKTWLTALEFNNSSYKTQSKALLLFLFSHLFVCYDSGPGRWVYGGGRYIVKGAAHEHLRCKLMAVLTLFV